MKTQGKCWLNLWHKYIFLEMLDILYAFPIVLEQNISRVEIKSKISFQHNIRSSAESDFSVVYKTIFWKPKGAKHCEPD